MGAMPAAHYLDEVRPGTGTGTGTYRMRLYATESNGAILGANAMRDHDVIFDEEHNRMGWVEADCHAPVVTTTATATTTATTTDDDAGFVKVAVTAFYGVSVVVILTLILASITIGYLVGRTRSGSYAAAVDSSGIAIDIAEEYGNGNGIGVRGIGVRGREKDYALPTSQALVHQTHALSEL